MKRIFTLIAQGLGAVLPLGLTVYAVSWLVMTLEATSRQVLQLLLPHHWYFPGLGLLSALVFLGLIGLLVNVYGVRYLLNLGDRLVQKIPLAKSIYASVKDIITVFQLGKNDDMHSVVRVDMGDGRYQLGFITGEKSGKKLFPGEDRVGVYFPMSYQIGGFTYYLPRSQLQPLDIGVEEAMRMALTGGAQSDSRSHKSASKTQPAIGD